MLTTMLIAFREFLEVFLIVGVFFGISQKLKLKKEREILFASLLGIGVAFLLAIVTYLFGDLGRGILNEENAEILESYLMIFSGFFIAYVVFSLHNVLRKNRGATLIAAHQKLQNNVFDISLFLTIVFLVVREGFEIALFTATTSLFAAFFQNLIGLFLGFFMGAGIGIATFFAYIKFPLGKIFKITEYMIILLGASMVQNGVTEFLEIHFNLHISDILSLPLNFLPDDGSVIGHMIKNLFGLDQEFSIARLSIMLLYIAIISFIFLKPQNKQKLLG